MLSSLMADELESASKGMLLQQPGLRLRRRYSICRPLQRERIHHLPELLGYDIASIPPMIAISWADGHRLEWTDSSPPPQARRDILRTVAEVTLDMLKIREPGKTMHWLF